MNRPTDKQAEHEWIDDYLVDRLPAPDRATLEMILETDPDFRNEVDALSQTHALLRQAFTVQRAVNTVQQLQRQDRQRQHRIRLGRRVLSGMAASLLLLVAFLSTTAVVLPGSENDTTVTRSLGNDRGLGQNRVFNEFFEGQAHLSEGQYALAVQNFERVVNTTNIRPYFHEAAQWHLTVAYLKSGQPDKAARLYNQFDGCIDCVYPVGTINRWKLWWQIRWAQWLD